MAAVGSVAGFIDLAVRQQVMNDQFTQVRSGFSPGIDFINPIAESTPAFGLAAVPRMLGVHGIVAKLAFVDFRGTDIRQGVSGIWQPAYASGSVTSPFIRRARSSRCT